MAETFKQQRSHQDYTIACICPMGIELAPVEGMLDEIHDPLPVRREQNAYTLGSIGAHNIVIAIMPEIGNNVAATVVNQLLNDFPSIRFSLLVGIGGGVPGNIDVRLGDVVVSQATDSYGGVIQYDFGRRLEDGVFQRTGQLNKPPFILSANVRKLQSQHYRQGSKLTELMMEMMQRYPNMQLQYARPVSEDRLFLGSYRHLSGSSCDDCDVKQIVERAARPSTQPYIYYGTIGSSNTVLKDALLREELRKQMNLLCVEMEAAGLMNDFPCIVIRGICDYADSHKNKEWQAYAAATAAAYMKELLLIIPPDQELHPSHTVKTSQIASQSMGRHLDHPQSNSSVIGQQSNNEHVDGMQNSKFGTKSDHDYSFRRPAGPCLGHAPSIENEFFIGREHELDDMTNILKPGRGIDGQHRIILGGMGGIGKTQLAIAYAQRHSKNYDSVFWLNATTEATIATSLHTIAECIFTARDYQAIDSSQVPKYVRSWLSDSGNRQWLLIFDNHDEPQKFDIQAFYPNSSHGTIIVTTRRPDLLNGRQFPVRSLHGADAGLHILQTRSGRPDTLDDVHARRLVERLAGLPIALATAGTFLRKSTWSFQQYLHAYEERWIITTRAPLVLPEYKDRTMYTTWNISYDLLMKEEPDAAGFLKILAYFDHQAIWFELLQAGNKRGLPKWLSNLANDPVDFESIMHILIDYCFIETHITMQKYSIHACVHDWILDGLNKPQEPWSYWYAFRCVSGLIKREPDAESLKHTRYASLTLHAKRLMNDKFIEIRQEIEERDLEDTVGIASLLRGQGQLHPASLMLVESLSRKEKVLGANHISTLRTIRSIGKLYLGQGKIAEAEQMHERALAGKEKALGPEHLSTLTTVLELGYVYEVRGKLMEAEQMYERALAGTEKALGPEDTRTLSTVHELGRLYRRQDRLAEAEQMYERALAGMEKAHGPEHTWTLTTVHALGKLYREQGRMVKAEQMYDRALVGTEQALGPEHTTTLITVYELGKLYQEQGRLVKAEQMYERAIAGNEKVLGSEHIDTLNVVLALGTLYQVRGKLAEAEQIYERVLAGMEKVLGPEHTWTLATVHDLGSLYQEQGRLAEAEQMFERALVGTEKALGPEHTQTLTTVYEIGKLYQKQGRLMEAEESFQRAATGLQKALGPGHAFTNRVLRRLKALKLVMTTHLNENQQVSRK